MQVDISMTTTDLMEAASVSVNIVVKCQHDDPQNYKSKQKNVNSIVFCM